MSESDNLRFDPLKMDTGLAEDYLKENKKFHSTTCCRKDNEKVTSDSCKNFIHYVENTSISCESQPISDLLVKMTQLADKLSANEDLFAQLDYMIRQRPIHEGKIHLDLIIKQFSYWSLNVQINECTLTGLEGFGINVTDDEQLLYLGIVAFALVHYSNIYIIATKQTAVICHLFTSLCHEIGLKNVHLILVDHIKEDGYGSYYLDKTDYSRRHCAGIITERSDIDSALDVFLTSTSTSPWSLKHLYIQESIYNNFKATMKWKCKKNLNDESDNYYDIYEYDSKLFMSNNFTESDVANKHVVNVEAYRTTKELLDLLTNCEPDYVSLWASDIAEANEIAHSVASKVVWINNFGIFNGPADISNSVYQNAFMQYLSIKVPTSVSITSDDWEKQDTESRRKTLLELVTNYEYTIGLKNDFKEFINTLKTMIKTYVNSFVVESKGVICIGIHNPIGALLVTANSDNNYLSKAIASLAYGNSLIIETTNYELHKGLFDLFMKYNVPVYVAKNNTPERNTIFIKSYYTKYFAKIKIIYLSYGTIFAN